MTYIKEEALAGVNVKSLASFLSLTLLATAMPFFIHLQLMTGPFINAIFILVLFLSGIRSAVVVALIPSLMAMSGGLLPAVLAPAVPFIMISNVIYILSIDLIYNRAKNAGIGYWAGVVIGSAMKFVFLFLSVGMISRLLIKHELAANVAQMMSWPQFATAIAGGVIAWAILKGLKRI